MPMILAVGGIKHGQHFGFNKVKNYAASNLYVSVLQDLGIKADAISSGKKTVTGLEMAFRYYQKNFVHVTERSRHLYF